MAIDNYKVSESGKVNLSDAGGENPTLQTISSLPNRPAEANIDAVQLKAIFDAIPLTYLGLGKINSFIDLYNGFVEYVKTQRGVAGGFATLNQHGRVLMEQMNNEALVEGVIEIALIAKEYDDSYYSGNSIKNKFDTKQDKTIFFEDMTIPINGFVADTTYEDYPFRASIPLTGVTNAMFADVLFSLEDSIGGKFACVCNTFLGGVYLYSIEANEDPITIPIIKVERT